MGNVRFEMRTIKRLIGSLGLIRKGGLPSVALAKEGQVTIATVLIILAGAVVLVAGLGLLTFNEIKKVNNVVKSAQSYYAAEAGIEDAVLRLRNRMSYDSNYTLNIGEGSTEVDISGPTTALVVTSRGNVSGRFRKIQVNLTTSPSSTNLSFNYGVQVGYGGLEMENNARINGNVYSNGSITGAPGAAITGDAFAATGTALTPDQVNDTPIPPPDSITFGNAAASQDVAQSFILSTTNTINKVSLYIRKNNNPSNATVRITNSSGSSPGTTTLASGTLDGGLVTGSFGWVDVTLSPNPELVAGTTYWLVIDGVDHASRYWIWAANTGYSSGEAKAGQYSGGPWNATGLDGYFKIFLGGLTTVIDDIDIGTGGAGDAHSNTITDSTIAGTPYCQTGSGNNKPCDTSQPDPSPQNMPISDANINEWKSEAEAGGVIVGDYTPPAKPAVSSLGPVKITGDLILDSPAGHNLTLTGTVWVEGNIKVDNNSEIRLDPAYGSEGGLMIADGWVHVDNLSQFYGSGIPDTYVLLLTTNDCNGTGSPTGQPCTHHNAAMDIHNNAGATILYTANGLLYLHQVIGVKQATAYKLHIENNAHIDYESGLANPNFSGGPGGVFEIISWQEVT